jgi:hypothetical protein
MGASPAGGARLVCPGTRTPLLQLSLIALLAVAVHGYHLGADDAAIYVPGIKKVADPRLYPFGAEFFQTHARLTFFPNLVGGVARVTHMPVDQAIFASHLAGMLLLMLASWRLLCACFQNPWARWSGIALLAGALSVPVAGTALAIADPYVTSRTFSTPLTMLSIACFVSGRRKWAAVWWVATALIHPQMSFYCGVFLVCLAVAETRPLARIRAAMPAAEPVALAVLPFLFALKPGSDAARRALLSRPYFLVSHWAWYEWLGVFAPVAMLLWFAAANPRGTTPAFRLLARSLPPFASIFTLAGILLLHPRLENFTRLQPMRSLHLLYVVFFLLLGGLLGEYALRRSLWRWLALFVPLAVSMWLLQRSVYPASAHVEWSEADASNAWTSAFFWIRHHTPKDAVFALDPYYMASPGEDMHGFRAVAERSVLADAVKDSGAVSLFPRLAEHWDRQVQVLKDWKDFELADYERVARLYPVTWIVARQPAPFGLLCPYQNQTLSVCQLPASAGSQKDGDDD